MGDRRGIEKGMPLLGIAPSVEIWPAFGGTKTGTNLGSKFVRYEFGAMLNSGEFTRVTISDPYYSTNTSLISKDYFTESKPDAPNIIYTSVGWDNRADRSIAQTEHTLVAVSPVGPNASTQNIEFIAYDHCTTSLSAGDGCGRCWTGHISDVVKQVIEEFGQPGLTVEFSSNTKDNEHNKWYQCRMPPRVFISSLLEWSTALSETKTRWLIWPVGDTVKIVEQARAHPKHRATYCWRQPGKNQPKSNDILEWELLANNSLQFDQHEFVTYGMSSVSGAYYDDKMDKEKKIVRIGRKSTLQQLTPKVEIGRTFSPVDNDIEPGGAPAVGWTMVPSVPEPNAGEVGVPYSDWLSGYARGNYLKTVAGGIRARFRVPGHYIWGGSEGLGVDTFNTIIMTATGKAHFLHGNWIIYGFKHTATRSLWYTDLYGYRLDKASGKEIGK